MAARRNARSVSEAIIRLSGRPNYLGVIDFTSVSKTNGAATTPFSNTGNNLLGKCLLLQTDQDCYIEFVQASATATTSTTGVKILAGERVIVTSDDVDSHVPTTEQYGFLACIRSTANGNLKIWELL